VTVEGFVAPGWEEVAETFASNLEREAEAGGAVSVVVDGACVVDLWGGRSDTETGAAWKSDTVVPVFSTTKGVTALCAHLLSARGIVDLDAPVARYWPEFAQGGKDECTVRWLLTHQAGLPFVDRRLTFDDLRAVTPVLRALEEQTPKWVPGTRLAYHPITYGFLVGELIRRVSGMSLGAFVRREFAEPLGLQMWLGLPPDARVDLARLEAEEEPPPSVRARALKSVTARSDRFDRNAEAIRLAMTLSGAIPAGLVTGQPRDFNDRELLAVELGAANLVTNARSLARLYGATVSTVDGVRLLADDEVSPIASYRVKNVRYWQVPPGLSNLLLRRAFPMGLGFMVTAPIGPTTFGHWGAGGSLAFADLDARLGFGYVVNRMERDHNARSRPLVDAVKRCLARGD
jgi:CubicO group peptidase (beta-lactamase class C family)